MSVGAAERSMGRKKSETPRNDLTVKVDAEIVQKARLIAVAKGMTIAELLSDTLRAPIDRLYDEVVASLGKPKGKGKPER